MKKTNQMLVIFLMAAGVAHAARLSEVGMPPVTAMTGALPRSQAIDLDQLKKQQALDFIRKAPDSTVFISQGQRKTKAQLIAEESNRRAPAAPKANDQFEAERSKLEGEQDAKVQTANAQAKSEFAALKQKFSQEK